MQETTSATAIPRERVLSAPEVRRAFLTDFGAIMDADFRHERDNIERERRHRRAAMMLTLDDSDVAALLVGRK